MVLTDGNVVLVSTMDHHVVVRVCKHVALPCLLADSLVGVQRDSEATQPGHQLANLIGTVGSERATDRVAAIVAGWRRRGAQVSRLLLDRLRQPRVELLRRAPSRKSVIPAY